MNHCLFVEFVGETEARPVVGAGVVGDLAVGAHHHVGRQTCARDAGGKAADAAQGRQLLDQPVARIPIHLAAFRPSLLAYGRFGSIPRQERIVVSQPVIQGEPWRDLPGILEEGAQHPARPFLLIHVAAAGTTVGNVQQEGSKGIACGGGRRGKVCLCRPKALTDLGQRAGEVGGIESYAKLYFVASDDLRVGAAQFVGVRGFGSVIDAFAAIAESTDARTGEQRTSARRRKAAHKVG